MFSDNGENIIIERVERKPIYLSINGELDKAAEKGEFWFLGPFRCLTLIFDKGLMQGTLELGYDKMTFITSLCTLNYRDFKEAAGKLKETAKQLKLELDFQSIYDHQVKLTIESPSILSVDGANSFVNKLVVLKKSIDRFSE